MSRSTFDPTQKKCDVCGTPLGSDAGTRIRVLELSYQTISDLRKVDDELADELLEKDGRLTYHGDCQHRIHEYLPEKSQPIPAAGGVNTNTNGDDGLVDCPVCRIPVLRSAGECGRCGHKF